MFVSKYNEEDKKRWLEEFMNSQKPAQVYAREIGIPASTLRLWARKEMNKQYAGAFGEVIIEEDSKTICKTKEVNHLQNPIQIILIDGNNREQLKNILEVLTNVK